MRTAVYPGSFDPFTNGHLDVLAQALQLFDEVIVAVLENPGKTPLFGVEDRVRMIEQTTSHMTGVVIDSFMGLLADYVQLKGACAIVRGLRDNGDFENELRMAHMNRELNANAVTLFLPTSHEYCFISSSLVKDVVMHGGDVHKYVPEVVAKELNVRYPLNRG